MKASQSSDAQKAFILKQGADGVPAAEAARGREWTATEAGGGLVAGQGDAAGRDPPKTVRPGRKRELVAQLGREWDVSIRRACGVLEFDTSTYHYKARRRPGRHRGSDQGYLRVGMATDGCMCCCAGKATTSMRNEPAGFTAS